MRRTVQGVHCRPISRGCIHGWGLAWLDEDTVIDVPQPFDKMEMYCASLGHKGNHSFTPNCKYDPYVQALTTKYKMPPLFLDDSLYGQESKLLCSYNVFVDWFL